MAITRPSLSRHANVGAVFFALLLSLACSVSMQYGHADGPVAKDAAGIKPLQVGQAAPRFIVETVDRDPFVFDPQSLERPVLLVSFRGGWCPYCNLHLSELRHVIPDIDARGVDVLFLSGDRPGLLYRSLDAETQADIASLDYTLLSDADAQAAIALGIAFEASSMTVERRREKGDDIEGSSMLRRGILPVPAVFAIGTDGKVAFAYANPDYKVRLPADELLAVAVRLTGGK
jgi:peroxiredoxin